MIAVVASFVHATYHVYIAFEKVSVTYKAATLAVVDVLALCVIIMIISCVYDEKKQFEYPAQNRREGRMFMHMLFFGYALIWCSLWMNIAGCEDDDSLMFLFCTGRMIACVFLLVSYVLYILAQAGASYFRPNNRELGIALNIIYLLSALELILIIINGLTGFMLKIEDGEVVSNEYTWIIIAFPLVVLILNAMYVYIQKGVVIKGKGSYIIVALTTSIGLFLSTVTPSSIFLNIAIYCSLLILYIRVHTQLKYENAMGIARLIEAQQQLMLTQIQPHFLFNTLNSIYQLCGESPELAREAIDDFATYLRMNLDSIQSNKLVCFDVELRHVKTYVKMEQLRFGDKLKVEFDIQEQGFWLPPLSVQPMVENAIKHGICVREEGGCVKVSTRKIGRNYCIEISDDGVGFDVEAVQNDGKVHIGIDNVKGRLAKLCGGSLNISSCPGKGTKVFIAIPVERRR